MRTTHSLVMVLATALLLSACGPAYVVEDQPVAYAGGGAVVGPAAHAVQGDPLVAYWGPHPVPAAFGGGFDFTEGPHTRPYYPVHPELYVMHDGYFAFIGDPYFYGYNGPMRWYAGPHMLHYPWGGVVCNIDGPHRHWEWNTVYVHETEYIYEDGFYVYVGLWPAWYVSDRRVYLHHYWPRHYREHYHPMVERSRRAVHKHPPKHVSQGGVGHHKKTPKAQGVPGGPGAAGNGRHRTPGILPAYDENRSERQRAAGEHGTAGIYRQGNKRPAPGETRRGAEVGRGGDGARGGAKGGHLPAYDENRREGFGRKGDGATRGAKDGTFRGDTRPGATRPDSGSDRGSRNGKGRWQGSRPGAGASGGHLPAYNNGRGDKGVPGTRGGVRPTGNQGSRYPGAGDTSGSTRGEDGSWKGPANTKLRKPGQGNYQTKPGSQGGAQGTYGNYPKFQPPNATRPDRPGPPSTNLNYNMKKAQGTTSQPAKSYQGSRASDSQRKKATTSKKSSSSRKRSPARSGGSYKSSPSKRSSPSNTKSSGGDSSRSRRRR